MLSEEHRQARATPDALKADARAGVLSLSRFTASMPPAAKKLLANVARAVKSVGVPRLARKIFGRAPVRARNLSDASRSASNGSARRIAGSGSNICSGPARRGGGGIDARTGTTG